MYSVNNGEPLLILRPFTSCNKAYFAALVFEHSIKSIYNDCICYQIISIKERDENKRILVALTRHYVLPSLVYDAESKKIIAVSQKEFSQKYPKPAG
jgi:hypothetical protein